MRWIIDEDGDVGITFWGIVTFVKYKQDVIVHWFKQFPVNAPKYFYNYKYIIANNQQDEF